MVRFHSICIDDKILSEVNLSKCCRRKKQTVFSGQINIGRIRFNVFFVFYKQKYHRSNVVIMAKCLGIIGK